MIQNVSEINNYKQINNFSYSDKKYAAAIREPLNSFEKEDEAIISAQAKILNELERFNSGEGNELDLAVACITGKHQVEAVAKVIKTKNEMMDSIFDAFDN